MKWLALFKQGGRVNWFLVDLIGRVKGSLLGLSLNFFPSLKEKRF